MSRIAIPVFALIALASSPHTGPVRADRDVAAVEAHEASPVRASSVEVPRRQTRTVEDAPLASETGPSPSGVTTPTRDDPVALLDIIRRAAAKYAIDAASFERCAYQESSLRPDVIDGTVRGDGGLAVGLFQFHERTFVVNARRLYGHDIGDRRTDPRLSADVAAWMWSIGQRGQWGCRG